MPCRSQIARRGLSNLRALRVGGAPPVQKGVQRVNENNFYFRIFRNELHECLCRFLERIHSRQVDRLSDKSLTPAATSRGIRSSLSTARR